MNKGRTLLRVLRAQREPRMTQSNVARAVAIELGRGFSSSRYSQIETGQGAEPSTEERDAIAKVLGTTVGRIDWPVFELPARAS